MMESAARLTDADCRCPSLLPGWSRGHVLAHWAPTTWISMSATPMISGRPSLLTCCFPGSCPPCKPGWPIRSPSGPRRQIAT
ncbi:MAG TPA: maleylpyruvate isomerase N-terminal domain-containing protein [Streptosporangiaceae bacterium]|nr:maleylpyruvate isomerase N-terminal domain-containing protein [Streptosporangiaceae bacterium]